MIPATDNRNRKRSYVPGHHCTVRIDNWNAPTSKKCAHCNNVLPLSSFYHKTYRSKVNSKPYRRYRSECRKCTKKAAKFYSGSPAYKRDYRARKQKEDPLDFFIKKGLVNWRKKDPNCDLTLKYLTDLFKSQEGLCYYSGEELKFGPICQEHISLDRKDPSLGYKQDNVVWCIFRANTMKGSLNEDEFYRFMTQILLRHTSQE